MTLRGVVLGGAFGRSLRRARLFGLRLLHIFAVLAVTAHEILHLAALAYDEQMVDRLVEEKAVV